MDLPTMLSVLYYWSILLEPQTQYRWKDSLPTMPIVIGLIYHTYCSLIAYMKESSIKKCKIKAVLACGKTVHRVNSFAIFWKSTIALSIAHLPKKILVLFSIWTLLWKNIHTKLHFPWCVISLCVIVMPDLWCTVTLHKTCDMVCPLWILTR